MAWRSAAIVLLFATLGYGCGGEPDATRIDLVGKPKSVDTPPSTPSDTGGSVSVRGDNLTVDMLQDLVFRKKRDGWDLNTSGAHVNVDKLRVGGVDLLFSAVQTEPGKGARKSLDEGLAVIEGLVAATAGAMVIVSGISEAMTARKSGKIAVAHLLEGADALVGADRDLLFDYKKKGLVVVGLVGSRSNGFADSAVAPATREGLTEEGARFVDVCRDLGIAIDLTHASPETFWDVLVERGALAMVSHTAARALRDHPRNLDDVQITALVRYGGIVGLVFNPDFLVPGVDPTAGMDDVVAHMAHIKKIGAVRGLALGTDFNGIRPPRGLGDVSALGKLPSALEKAGFTREEISGLMGSNAKLYLERIETKSGAAEVTGEDLLRPIRVDCETVLGESSGVPAESCNGYYGDGPQLQAATRQRLRLNEMDLTPVRLEIRGEPGTPWQVEAQNLNGKVLIRRGIALGPDGRGLLNLPGGRNLTRVFISPTRPSRVFEATVWGR